MNEELSNIMTKSFSLSKIWMMVAKNKNNLSEDSDLIPKENFKLTKRTQVVNIKIKSIYKPSLSVDMELTPCVNFTSQRPSLQSKKSLFQSGSSQRKIFSTDIQQSPLLAEKTLNSLSVFNKNKRIELSSSLFEDDTIENLNRSTIKKSNFSCNMIETPVVQHQHPTPSPIKRLCTGLNDVQFYDDIVWCQMLSPLIGFR